MAATDLGKVGIVMKGTWSSSAPYEALDAVSYNGGLYIAKQAVPANTVPTNTTYWQAAIAPSGLVTPFTITAEEGFNFSYSQSFTIANTFFMQFMLQGGVTLPMRQWVNIGKTSVNLGSAEKRISVIIGADTFYVSAYNDILRVFNLQTRDIALDTYLPFTLFGVIN